MFPREVMTREEFLSLKINKQYRPNCLQDLKYIDDHRVPSDGPTAILEAEAVVSFVYKNSVYITFGNPTLTHNSTFSNTDYMRYYWYRIRGVKKYPQRGAK